jgi:hypothetical protein
MAESPGRGYRCRASRIAVYLRTAGYPKITVNDEKCRLNAFLDTLGTDYQVPPSAAAAKPLLLQMTTAAES